MCGAEYEPVARGEDNVAAQALWEVVRLRNSPSHNAIPIIGEIFLNISSPVTTLGSQ